MDRNKLVVAFLLGVCAALSVALILQSGNALPKAYAQATGTAGDIFAVTGTGTQGQGRDVLFVIDAAQTRLMVYEYKNERLTVGAIRNFEFDARFQEFPGKKKPQKPSVNEMRKLSEAGKK